jgi:8-oxo-dGTP pyrophosphatase MutT (NUDIX family)
MLERVVPYRPIPPWQVLESRLVVDRRWIEVHEQRVRLGNGHEIPEFHKVVMPSWAAVLCVTAEDEVVLVRQYRHGISQECIELPAGVIEPDESPLEAAKRELLEETGYVADDWTHVLTTATEPSRHTVHAHFFCARGARADRERAPEPSEDIELLTLPRAELVPLCESGGIVHGIHIGAILLAERKGLLAGVPRR